MSDHAASEVFRKLDALRTELVDLAFTLECRGRRDAADVAVEISARVAELRDECAMSGAADVQR